MGRGGAAEVYLSCRNVGSDRRQYLSDERGFVGPKRTTGEERGKEKTAGGPHEYGRARVFMHECFGLIRI